MAENFRGCLADLASRLFGKRRDFESAETNIGGRWFLLVGNGGYRAWRELLVARRAHFLFVDGPAIRVR